MQLNEILEENSVKRISQKTKIPEEYIEEIFAGKFENLKKIKTLGFISILEREYKADLSTLREDAYEHYAALGEDKSNTLGISITEDKKGKSTFFKLLVLGLLGYATWYFLTQLDKKQLGDIMLFIEDSSIEKLVTDTNEEGSNEEGSNLDALSIGSQKPKAEVRVEEAIQVEELIIEKTTRTPETEEAQSSQNSVTQSFETSDLDSVVVTETVEDIIPEDISEAIEPKIVSIVPVGRLWFGVVDTTTKQREHFSISEPYALDVSRREWLIATSSAPFSILEENERKDFNDAQEHYFKIDVHGVATLSKNEYIALGGWPQW